MGLSHCMVITLTSTSTQVASSSLEAHRVMLGLLDARSSLIPTGAGVLTVVVPSLARTQPRSIVLLLISAARWPSLLSKAGFANVPLFSSLMPLVLPSRCPSSLRHTAQNRAA